MPRRRGRILPLTSVHSVARLLEALGLGDALNDSLVKPFLEVQRHFLQLLEARLLHELAFTPEARSFEVSDEVVLARSPRILPVVIQRIIL